VCGCSRNNQRRSVSSGVTSAPRSGLTRSVAPQPESLSIAPQPQVTLPTPTNSADRRRIEKLQQQAALRRALGR